MLALSRERRMSVQHALKVRLSQNQTHIVSQNKARDPFTTFQSAQNSKVCENLMWLVLVTNIQQNSDLD